MKPLLLLLFVFQLDTGFFAQQVGIPFIDSSIVFFRGKDDSGEIPLALQDYYNWYLQDMNTCETKKYYSEFTQKITDLYAYYGHTVLIQVKTDKSGAKVKYQTIFEREAKKQPNEFTNPTNNSSMKLPPGYYFIWCERDGKPSSDKEKRVTVDGNTVVTLLEDK